MMLMCACLPNQTTPPLIPGQQSHSTFELHSVVRGINKKETAWFWDRKKRRDTFSMRVRRPALKQKWTNRHSGLPIRDKRGGQGLTDPVYSQLFTSLDVSSDSSQLLTAVKQRAQQPLTITRPGRQTGIQKKGMQGTRGGGRGCAGSIRGQQPECLSSRFKGTS